jgi:hypothetical protein
MVISVEGEPGFEGPVYEGDPGDSHQPSIPKSKLG